MALIDCNDPIFDRKVDQILQLIEEGKEKTEIAAKLGYQNPISIDNYMRRRNFSWDSRQKNFVPAAERYSAKANDNVVPLRGVSKAELIISLFDQGELNVKEIVKQSGFENNKEMSKFMKKKGYMWDPTEGNYLQASPLGTVLDTSVEPITQTQSNTAITEVLQNLIPLLSGNHVSNQVMVKDQIETSEPMKLPRYTVVGQYTTKGMRMAISLDELIRKYSREYNISQREIFEVALIEFFQKYGYKTFIEKLII